MLNIEEGGVSEACPICHGGAKSVFHLLTSCPFAKECCCVGPYHVWVYTGQSPIFLEWLEAMLNKGYKEAHSEIAMLCCREVWAHRNGVVWNSKLSTAHQVLSQTRLMFHQWSAAQYASVHPLPTAVDPSVRW